MIILETSGENEEVERDDVRVVEIPGVETAARLGNALARNMVLLGAYVEKLAPLPAALIEEEIARKFPDNGKMRELNLNAFREGMNIARSA